MTNARVQIGGNALARELQRQLSDAGTDASLRLFRLEDADMADAIARTAERVPTRAIIDTDAFDDARGSVQAAFDGVQLLGSATAPHKQHGKSIVIDGGRSASIATDFASADAGDRVESIVTFGGHAATTLHALDSAAHAGDAAAARIQLGAARRAGIVANEPDLQVQDATDAVHGLVQDARGELLFVTKKFDSTRLARELADAVEHRGVSARLVVGDVADGQAERMEKAGVDIVVRRERDPRLHGTVLVSDDRALVGSLYATDEVLVPNDERRSRELAVVLGGDAARQANDGIRAIVD